MKVLRKIAIAFALLLGGLLIVCLWIGYAEHSASQKAEAFCRETKVGDKMADVVDRIASAGADRRQSRVRPLANQENWVPVTFTGAMPLSRHVCTVHFDHDKVTKAEVRYID